MERSFIRTVLISACALLAARARADEPRLIPLWPEGVPGAKAEGGVERIEDGRVYNVQSPSLTYFPAPPASANGAAVIICPGGGYVRLAISKV